MTYTKFLQTLPEVKGLYLEKGIKTLFTEPLPEKDRNGREYSRRGFQYHSNFCWYNKELVLFNSWRSGGQSGGSCWDTGNEPARHHAISGDPEPSWTDLDNILEHFVPNITLLQFRKLDALFQITDYSESEYYGNYTTYTVKYIKVKDLHQLIQTILQKKTDA